MGATRSCTTTVHQLAHDSERRSTAVFAGDVLMHSAVRVLRAQLSISMVNPRKWRGVVRGSSSCKSAMRCLINRGGTAKA